MYSKLPENRKDEIEKKLPEACAVQNQVIQLMPDMVAAVVGPNSKLDIACICLQDACDTACDAVYALRQAHANLIWYREESPKAPDEMTAIHYARFYLDDVALRAYSAGEHMSKFLVYYFDIGDAELKKIKKSSRFERIAHHLNEQSSNSQITTQLLNLIKDDSWITTVQYRNDWVHNQPWLIEGLGIVFERKVRWQETPNKQFYELRGGGDKPKCTIENLIETFTSALNSLVLVLSECYEFLYETVSEKRGDK